ncbi:MAG: type II toxin-antitoxin system Phd/YefM family antitoxin [Planctomycetota bacterium]
MVINIYEAKAKFSKLIREVVRSGKPVTICRNGVPEVDIVVHPPEAPGDPLQPDPMLAGAVFHGDPFAPVDESDWPPEARG